MLDAAIEKYTGKQCEWNPKTKILKVDGIITDYSDLAARTQELKDEYDSQAEDRELKAEYMKKTPYEQIEMLGDGTYQAWKTGIQNRVRSRL